MCGSIRTSDTRSSTPTTAKASGPPANRHTPRARPPINRSIDTISVACQMWPKKPQNATSAAATARACGPACRYCWRNVPWNAASAAARNPTRRPANRDIKKKQAGTRHAAERYSRRGTEFASKGSHRSAAATNQLLKGGWNLSAVTLLVAAGSTASKMLGTVESSRPFNRHWASVSESVADCKATTPGNTVSTTTSGESDAARSRMGNTSLGRRAASSNRRASSTTVTAVPDSFRDLLNLRTHSRDPLRPSYESRKTAYFVRGSWVRSRSARFQRMMSSKIAPSNMTGLVPIVSKRRVTSGTRRRTSSKSSP